MRGPALSADTTQAPESEQRPAEQAEAENDERCMDDDRMAVIELRDYVPDAIVEERFARVKHLWELAGIDDVDPEPERDRRAKGREKGSQAGHRHSPVENRERGKHEQQPRHAGANIEVIDVLVKTFGHDLRRAWPIVCGL